MIRRDDGKEKKALRERGISLAKLAEAIENGNADVCLVNDQKDHEGQRMFVVILDGYPHCVPFVEEKNGDIFLKTAFKSRKRKKGDKNG